LPLPSGHFNPYDENQTKEVHGMATERLDQANGISLDALIPAEMASKAEQIGVKKAHMNALSMFVLAVLAGAFIALGAVFSNTIVAGSSALPYGVVRLLAGLAFSLGLILVVVGGAELFTGNNLIVMAWASGKVDSRLLLTNWVIVYLGNFAGALATAAVVFLSRQFTFGQGTVGAAALATANSKVGLDFIQAIALGIFCNALVCLAVWMSFSARTTTDRILVIVPPVTAFVAAGFEHSIANMYYVPVAMLIKAGAPASFWTAIGKTPADFPNLTWDRFLVNNLLPVTIGNIIGGALMVGVVYWFVYLRGAAGATALARGTGQQKQASARGEPAEPTPVAAVENGHR
jgi:formate transporter FocA